MSIVLVKSEEMTIPPELRQRLGVAQGGELELVEFGEAV